MKKFHFNELLAQSWKWTKKNLSLWWLGLFVGLGSLVFDFRSTDIQDAFTQVFNDSGVDGLKNFLSNVGNASMLVFWLGVIFIILSIIGILARAGLICGVKKIKDGEQYRLRDLAEFGVLKIPRLLLLEIILGIPFYILLIPVVVYVKFIASQILFALFAICLAGLIAYSVFLALFKHYAYCYAILDDQTAWNAIISGIKLLKQNFWNFVVVKLIQAGLWIVAALAMSVAVVVAMLPVLLIGILLSFVAGSFGSAAMAALSGVIGIAAVLAFRAGMNVFFAGYLTGAYWEARE
ncbi:MAG: hypothetical protein V1928_01015 [Parcubacteria group bacterium]